MTVKKAAMLPAAVALLAASPALAQTASSDDDQVMFVSSISVDRAQCNLRKAVRLDFTAALARRAEFHGRCVAVTGYVAADALFGSAAEVGLPSAQSDPALADRRFGLYASGAALTGPARPKRATSTIVGVIDDCDRDWLGGVPLGYCHYTRGPILIVTQIIHE